jgi:2-iminoacetate synthase ThiH
MKQNTKDWIQYLSGVTLILSAITLAFTSFFMINEVAAGVNTYVGITVSSRETATFRNGIAKICATKISAGVSTGIGDHEEKYEGHQEGTHGDEQFEIADNRSIGTMYADMSSEGLQPVLNDYVYV